MAEFTMLDGCLGSKAKDDVGSEEKRSQLRSQTTPTLV